MIVYKIINKINSKIYIGLTKHSLEYRWKKHLERLNSKRPKTYLYNAMLKYGVDNFTIEKIDSGNTIKELNLKEAYWADFYSSYYPKGYNLKECGKNLGSKNHEQTILKRSKEYTFKSPSGDIINIKNLKDFCSKNNLDVCHMYKLAKGKRIHHKGWTLINTNIPFVILKSPNNEIIKVILFHTFIADFCKKQKIKDMTGIYMLIYKYEHVNQYKGWIVIERNLP